MNPSTNSTISSDFPRFFWSILAKSLGFYKRFFINYLALSFISFVPFLLVDLVTPTDFIDLMEFFHGNFLDVLIFLTLPTIYMQQVVLPVATLQLFLQRFFTSVVLITFIQLGTLLFFSQFFAQISLGAIMISLIPYIYLIFAGFFLIMENSPKLISVKINLINSIKLTRTRFFHIFWNYCLVTLLIVTPLIFFTFWYMTDQPEVVEFMAMVNQPPSNDQVIGQKFVALLEVFKDPVYKWSRVGIHLLFRPLKSLFICFLFLGIIFQLVPDTVNRFLGIAEGEDTIEVDSDEDKDDDTDEGPTQIDIH